MSLGSTELSHNPFFAKFYIPTVPSADADGALWTEPVHRVLFLGKDAPPLIASHCDTGQTGVKPVPTSNVYCNLSM
jgi:hypothetical protein